MLIPRAAVDNGTIGVRHGTTVPYGKRAGKSADGDHEMQTRDITPGDCICKNFHIDA